MPQMAPINWLFLFIMFIIVYLMFNMLNYFIFKSNFKSSKKMHFNKNLLNWKW